MFGRLTIAALALCLCAPAYAQEGAAPDAPAPAPAGGGEIRDERVTVTGRRPAGMSVEQYTRNFVKEVADPISRNFGIARWDRYMEVCVAVENISADAAQYIVDRVSLAALDVGLRIGAPGCRPNIAIIFASDGPALASFLAEEQPRMFRPFGGTGGTTQGLHALEAFKHSEAPVRWWQISMPVDQSGNVAIALPGSLSGPPTVAGANSRISSLIKDQLWNAVVIVDASRLNGVSFGQLGDYLSMVTLSQVDPEADARDYDTILNLFSDAVVAPTEMTEWDRAYLRATYEFDQMRRPEMQRGALVRELVDARNDIAEGE